MVQKITCRYFKRFEEQEFEIDPLTLLAGPNNSGKSTLLHAVMVWNLALKKWVERKGPQSSSRAKERTGTPITRQEFTALPLPSMDQLWTDTHTALKAAELADGQNPGGPRLIVISLEGNHDGEPWKLGFELKYSGSEQIHVKPVASDIGQLERVLQSVSVIYIPPFSGIGVNETRYDQPYQDMLVGQGKGGDIIRNLLLKVAESEEPAIWEELALVIRQVFQYTLLKPQYTGKPFISCEYLILLC
jgi:hypothetical protein